MSEPTKSPAATSTSILARLREPGSVTQVALLRAALGLHLLGVLSSPSLSLLLEIGPTLHPQSHVVGGQALFGLLTPGFVEAARAIGLVAAGCFVVGLGGRITVGALLSAFLITQMYWFGATLFHDDWIYFVFPLMAFFVPDGPTAYSVDGWRLARRGGPPRDAELAGREARFVIEAWVFWIALVYVAAGIAKLFPLHKGIEWLSGRAAQEFAIEFVRQSPAVTLFGDPLFPYQERWLFCVGSIGTVLVELGACLLLFDRRFYLPLALAIFGLHISIWLVGIPGFVGMFSVLVLALLPARLFQRFDARRQASAASTSASKEAEPEPGDESGAAAQR